MCVSVCQCVCVSNLWYPERKVVSLRPLHQLEELHLASCTNCFSSLYVVLFERKSLWKFFNSYARYPEREVVSPRYLHHLEELRLASCTNYFSSLYDSPFERKSLWNFFASFVLNPVHARLLFRLPWAGLNLPTT